MSKKILVDIYHLPQFNFFKNVILSFNPDEIDIFCVNRGKLAAVIKYELPEYNVTVIGDYKFNKGMFSMIFRIILPRFSKLFFLISSKKYKYIITAHYQANLIAKLKGIPNIAFIDDPRKIVFPIIKFSADKLFVPPFQDKLEGVEHFNALKEWSYLSPKYFNPNVLILELYNVRPKEYIFIREVSTDTSNYLSQASNTILSIAEMFSKDIPVLISVENKQLVSEFPSHWIVLKEPLKDVHSLIYYSKVTISSGDSVAREGAMLGVPSIYAGIRDMPANKIMIEKGMLLKLKPIEVYQIVDKIFSGELIFEDQNVFRERLFKEWADFPSSLIKLISKI